MLSFSLQHKSGNPFRLATLAFVLSTKLQPVHFLIIHIFEEQQFHTLSVFFCRVFYKL